MPPPLTRALGLFVLVLLASSGAAQEPLPRRPLELGFVQAAPLPPELVGHPDVARRLVVKFVDGARARSTSTGELLSLSGSELAGTRTLALRYGLSFAPLLRVPEERLTDLEERAAGRSGRAQPDLAGMLIVDVPEADVARLERIGQALQNLEVVEFAYVQTLGVPPPGDIMPTTPDLTNNQSYIAQDPGFDVTWARARGYRGGTVRLSDCEYGWNPDHEDLNDIDLHLEPGQTIDPGVFSNGWDSHGTAVVGSSSAVDNDYGITGIADEAAVYTYTEWSVQEGFRRSTAIANAITDSAPGDLVLLEMQTTGAGGGYAPAEVDPAVFNIVKAGADAGVIVVAAAGNGSQDLDSGPYATYRGWGDSGSIIVGAGSSNGSHSRLSFSTYGSRVDVQGWGGSVFTLGYGDYAQYGGDKNQRYTSSFNGTSSASGQLAPVCAVLQDAAETLTGSRLTPHAMRTLLKATGIPQGSGGNIGPFPDLRAAIEALPTLLLAELQATPRSGAAPLPVDFTDLSFGTVTSRLWDFGDGATSTAQDPTHVYTVPGLYDVSLSVTGPSGTDVLTRSGYILVDAALAVTNVSPEPLPALLPGTMQDVVVTGADFAPSATVAIDGVPLALGTYTVVDDTTITLDMPQLSATGPHTLTVSSQGVDADFPMDVIAPATPALQIGNGDALNNNTLPSAGGADVVCAGLPGETHYVLHSSQSSPSVLPGLISLDIGAAFSDLDLVVSQAIPAAGWAEVSVPFPPTFAALYFQSFTLDQGKPLAVSNQQAAILLP